MSRGHNVLSDEIIIDVESTVLPAQNSSSVEALRIRIRDPREIQSEIVPITAIAEPESQRARIQKKINRVADFVVFFCTLVRLLSAKASPSFGKDKLRATVRSWFFKSQIKTTA